MRKQEQAVHVSWRAKLSPKDVRDIRALWKSGKYTQDSIAQKYRVSQTAISFLLNKQTYRKVA